MKTLPKSLERRGRVVCRFVFLYYYILLLAVKWSPVDNEFFNCYYFEVCVLCCLTALNKSMWDNIYLQ